MFKETIKSNEKLFNPLKKVFQLVKQNCPNYSTKKLKLPTYKGQIELGVQQPEKESIQDLKYIIKLNNRVIWTGIDKRFQTSYQKIYQNHFQKQKQLQFNRSNELKIENFEKSTKNQRKISFNFKSSQQNNETNPNKIKSRAQSLTGYFRKGQFALQSTQVNQQISACIKIRNNPKKQKQQNGLRILKKNNGLQKSPEEKFHINLPISCQQMAFADVRNRRKQPLFINQKVRADKTGST